MHIIWETVEVAEKKLKKFKELSIIEKIREELIQLERFTTEANNERRRCGMSEVCAECGKAGNSCCAQGVEFKYSAELIMLNLYFGVKIPFEPEHNSMCFFLTKNGCCLFVRDVFCINFICEKIKEKISSEKINKLRELEGFQLNLQFKLENFLKKVDKLFTF
ncbi:MAG: hypothetical protein NZ845_01240 [Thermodesulfovibrio sp.]|nr:hypothetical protein [Thermodesulfovibrio sp.]